MRESAPDTHLMTDATRRDFLKTGGRVVQVRKDGDVITVTCPPLDVHAILVGEG